MDSFYCLFNKISHYSTGRLQHDTDFAKTNQNEVVQIHTNFFDNFRIRKLICENEFGILNLEKKINDSKFIKIIRENEFKKETEFEHKL